jgi:hypothetical protein
VELISNMIPPILIFRSRTNIHIFFMFVKIKYEATATISTQLNDFYLTFRLILCNIQALLDCELRLRGGEA